MVTAMIYTESQLRQLSTNRLLNLLRKHRNFSSTTQDATFDKIKEILGNREHVPRKKPATPQKYKPIDYSSRFTTNTNTDQKRWTTLWKEVRQLPTRQKWIRLRTLNKDELEKLLKLSSSCTKELGGKRWAAYGNC